VKLTGVCFFFFFVFISNLIGEVRSEENHIDFGRTLLIINYNHPHYQSIDFIRKIYSKAFPNIVFYGEEPHPSMIQYKHHFGWYCQNVIADAMVRWPDFEGYLCLQDDCFMNYWNYGRLDKGKIWLHHDANYFNINSANGNGWSWWDKDCGRTAILRTYPILPPFYKEILIRNVGNNCVIGGATDMVYIPARLKNDFITLVPLFDQVFVELAIPTILSCLEDCQKWECLNYFWGCQNLNQQFSSELDWIHPIKFSNPNNQGFILKILRQRGL
jgi:hypothetical protein